MIFSSSDGLVCVNVLCDVKNVIEREVLSHYPYETGGILIGKYDENLRLATVYLATGPTKDSEHKPTAFKRGVSGIVDDITSAQKSISPALHYIGEWHSHPNGSSNASYVDLKQMQNFAKTDQLGISAPLLLIVGGRPLTEFEWAFTLHRYEQKPIPILPLK